MMRRSTMLVRVYHTQFYDSTNAVLSKVALRYGILVEMVNLLPHVQHGHVAV